MGHSAGDVLRHKRPVIENIERADAPSCIVEVFPVEETVLPVPAAAVPPFTGCVMGLLGILVNGGRASVLACCIIHGIGCQGIIDYASCGYPTGDDNRVPVAQSVGIVGISACHPSFCREIDPYARPAATAGLESAAVPTQTLVSPPVADDAAPSGEIRPVIQRDGWNKYVDKGPDDALDNDQDAVEDGIPEHTPRKQRDPFERISGSLFLLIGDENLQRQVVNLRYAVDEDVIIDGIDKPERGKSNIQEHLKDLEYNPEDAFGLLGKMLFLKQVTPGLGEEVLDLVEHVKGERYHVIAHSHQGPDRSADILEPDTAQEDKSPDDNTDNSADAPLMEKDSTHKRADASHEGEGNEEGGQFLPEKIGQEEKGNDNQGSDPFPNCPENVSPADVINPVPETAPSFGQKVFPLSCFLCSRLRLFGGNGHPHDVAYLIAQFYLRPRLVVHPDKNDRVIPSQVGNV